MTEEKAKKLFKKFFGRGARSSYKIDLGDLEHLTFIGIPTRIEYFANKKQHGAKDTIYYHDFEHDPVMLTNNEGVIIIFDKNLTVTERGIEG